MKNTIGNNIALTLFGESHGPLTGAVLDGLPAGFAINMERLQRDMKQRKAQGSISTARQEDDEVHIVSGFFEGRTTGTSLTILIENKAQRSGDYAALKSRLRPGHADFTAYEKYDGFQDYRGGGHFSGRLTAPLVAAGSICAQILEAHNVYIGSHIEQLLNLHDDSFANCQPLLNAQIERVNERRFPVLNLQTGRDMVARIEQTAKELDSLGGVLETAITGLPAGIGEPFFDSVEACLSHLLFSIPGVKGVSFGDGFGFAELKGSQANDPFVIERDKICTTTNHNGGINGGITNGMPVRIHTCVKPTPSIYKNQHSVDYQTKQSVELQIHGRHDPAIIHRARAVVNALCAFGILDLWIARNGTLSFQRAKPSNKE